jgi:uncharacterized membrane protein
MAVHQQSSRPQTSVTLYERVVLAVGLSIAVVPLSAIVLTFVSQPIGRESVLTTVAAITVGGAVGAAVRRYQYPPQERFCVPFRSALRSAVSYTTASKLNAGTVLLVVFITAGGGMAVVSPGEPERYTEFGILSEDANGTLSASAYPSELSTTDSETLYLDVGNYEGETVEYTTVILLQRDPGDALELDRRTLRVAPGESRIDEHQIQPPVDGEQLRLTYLLYRGPVPQNPTRSNAYRSVSLIVDVTD